MKITKQLCLSIGLAAFVSACSTGLGTNPALSDAEEPSSNLTDAELNALVAPPTVRGSSSYSYKPMKCNGSTSAYHGCSNVDLATDESSTNNTQNYYVFQNKEGQCLSSADYKITTTTCDLTSDYQKFRLSFLDTSQGRINIAGSGWEDDYFNRYEFAIIPKKNYNGKTQAYGSSSNPESYWLKKVSSNKYISQGGDCGYGESKCKYYFFGVGVTGRDGTYTLTDSDGTENNGSWFFIANKNFYHKSGQNKYCLRQESGRFKVNDEGKYQCNKNYSKNTWRVFQYSN